MSDSTVPPSNRSNGPFIAVTASLGIVVAAAGALGYMLYQSHQSEAALTDQVASLTSQLEDAQKEIAQLQPLAHRAREMPVLLKMDYHAINAGYNLYVWNQLRGVSLRFHYFVNGKEVRYAIRFNRQVLDGGHFTIIPGLAHGDMVLIQCEGYDDKTFTVQ